MTKYTRYANVLFTLSMCSGLTIRQLADGSFNSRGMSLQMYLRVCDQFVRRQFDPGILSSQLVSDHSRMFADLTGHHTIEERYIFPVLAKRMPEFRDDEKHITSHHAIHDGPSLFSLSRSTTS